MDSITIEFSSIIFVLMYYYTYVDIWLTSKRYSLWMASFINIKYTSSFLVCLIFLYVFCFCCCPVFILWEQPSTSLLTYLGQLTPLLAPGWEYDPRVVRESTDASGVEEAPNQRNEQELRALWVMKKTSYFYLLNWKMMGLDVLFACYHLVTACLRNKPTQIKASLRSKEESRILITFMKN